MVMPECPGDHRLRFGMWFGPDPAPEKPVAEADFTGTNADPAALQEFLGHFKLCGEVGLRRGAVVACRDEPGRSRRSPPREHTCVEWKRQAAEIEDVVNSDGLRQ